MIGAPNAQNCREVDEVPTSTTILSLAEAALAGGRLAVLDATVTQMGRRAVLKIVLDHPAALGADGRTTTPTPAVSLDDVAAATRILEAALDDSDAMGETAYTLEVTSPGLDRPLRVPHGYLRNVGRLLRLTLRDGTSVLGRVASAGADDVVLAVSGEKGRPGTERAIPYVEVARAVVEVEFTSAHVDSEDADDVDVDVAEEE